MRSTQPISTPRNGNRKLWQSSAPRISSQNDGRLEILVNNAFQEQLSLDFLGFRRFFQSSDGFLRHIGFTFGTEKSLLGERKVKGISKLLCLVADDWLVFCSHFVCDVGLNVKINDRAIMAHNGRNIV